MIGRINEDDIRAAYRFVAHAGRGVTELRVISPNRSRGMLGIGYFDSEAAFVEACAKVNGEANVYLGIQPRPDGLLAEAWNELLRLPHGAKDEDIAWLTAIVIDIDPVRPKGTAATDEELAQALECGGQIADWLESKDFVRPVRNMSGNGCQLWFAVPPHEIKGDNRDELSLRLRSFEAKIRTKFATGAVKIDSIYNLSRIIKVIGTLSVKGDGSSERPHRMSCSLDPFQRREDARLLEAILTMPLDRETKAAVTTASSVPLNIGDELSPLLRKLLSSKTRLRDLFDGRGKTAIGEDGRPLDTSSSGYDFSLALQLALMGLPADEIATALWHRPDQDAKRKGERYITHTVRKVIALAEAKIDPERRHSSKPCIQAKGRQLLEVIDDARDVILAANERRIDRAAEDPDSVADVPPVFIRGGDVVRLKLRGEHGPQIEELKEIGMYGLLARDATWFVPLKKDEVRDVDPPARVARDMIEFPPPGLPAIDMVIGAPVFARDGELLTSPGLHRAEKLWMHVDWRRAMPEIPKTPTPDDIARARALLFEDLFVDFPFVAEGDRAHAVCALLLPFARRMIDGLTPLHLVEAPSIGSGKGLICNVVAVLSTGSTCQIKSIPTDEEEMRKFLTSLLREGRPYVMLDNADDKHVLDSSSLAAVLTADPWTDRILGESRMVTLPNKVLWMMTGNNPQLSDEISRRCVRIRIDAKSDMPWLRVGFKHKPLVGWVQRNREQIVHAVLVLVQAWVAAGKPLSSATLGSYDEWAAVMGGILDTIGVPGFLGNLDDLYAGANAEREMWREFTAAWIVRFRNEPKRVGELNEMCEQMGLMQIVRGEGAERSQQIRLGKALQGVRDRRFGDLRIELERDDGHKGRRYVIVNEGDASTFGATLRLVGEIDPFADDGGSLGSDGDGKGMSPEATSPVKSV